MNIPTPRTDRLAACRTAIVRTSHPDWEMVVPAEFARKLERELAEAKARLSAPSERIRACAEDSKRGLTHPQIHVDYYAWLGTHGDFEKKFIEDHARSFQDFNAIAMWAWTQSRETFAKFSPPASPGGASR